MVRPRAGLQYRRLGEGQSFAAFEFECDAQVGNELRVVLDEATTNVLWPIGPDRCRWTFQLVRSELSGDFPEKERRPVRLARPAVDERIRQYVQKVTRERAPWFTSEVKRVDWCTEVTFEQALASSFGTDRWWLVGDAAHQTGPGGVQSMNMGFIEADALGSRLHKVLREAAPLQVLKEYYQSMKKEWHYLLRLSVPVKTSSAASAWTAQRSARMIACLPATGSDLNSLAAELGLSFP